MGARLGEEGVGGAAEGVMGVEREDGGRRAESERRAGVEPVDASCNGRVGKRGLMG